MSDAVHHPSVRERFLAVMRNWANHLTGGGNVAFGLVIIGFLALFLLFALLILLMYFACWVRYKLSIRSRSRRRDGENGRNHWRFRQRWDDLRASAAARRPSRREEVAMDMLSDHRTQQPRQVYYRAKIISSLTGRLNAPDKSQPPTYDSIIELPPPVHVADSHHHAGQMV